jgi:D-alanyl-D-alanine carboxypeptidase
MRFFVLFFWLFLGIFHSSYAGPALVFSAEDGRVLYSEDPDRLWHPASVTKLMTAYLVFEAIGHGRIKMDDKVTSSPAAFSRPPSKIGLHVGQQMSVSLALEVLIVKSANDVAVMLAEKVAGDVRTFVRMMNLTARRLGMSQTNFVNPSGLPDDGLKQVTTARDMGKLAMAIWRDYPQYKHLYAMKKVKVGRRWLRSHNGLLRSFEGADGMKTGFICASGFNIVASATRGKNRIIAVVFGERSSQKRKQRTAKLLQYGFEAMQWKKILAPKNLEVLPAEVDMLQQPENMRKVVCNRRR